MQLLAAMRVVRRRTVQKNRTSEEKQCNRAMVEVFLCKAINYRRLQRARREFIAVTSPGTKITWHEQIEISYWHLLLFLQCCAIIGEIK